MRRIINELMGLIIIMTITLLSNSVAYSENMESPEPDSKGESGELPLRSELADKYKWNLTDIYKSEAMWEQDYSEIEGMLPKIKSYEGKLGASAENLLAYFKLEEEITTKFERLRLYASLSKDLDLRDSKYQEMYERAMNLGNKLSSESSFVTPEILDIPEDELWGFLKKNKALKHYKHYLDNIIRRKSHTLGKDEEKIMSYAVPVEAAFMNTYSMFTGADIKYPVIKDENGNDIQMSPARYYSAMMSTDRDYRKRAYKAIYVPYMNNINFLTANYNGSIKAKIFKSKSRHYSTTLEAALDANNIPLLLYTNLIIAVRENLEPLQKWGKLKKKLLGLDEFHPYDTYVNIYSTIEKKFSPDEAMKLCIEALKPLGKDYIKNLKYAFDNRWVDFYETEGKRNGAYSTGAVKGIHPFVLMNWGYTLNDVFTLAHEMGHNMHSWYTMNNQQYPYADYPIFLAEVASTTNEALLLHYLLENSASKEEKLTLLETALNNIKVTFYRQTRFAEFEFEVQARIENGEAMTAEKFAEIFGDMYQKYWGDEMVVDVEERNSWPRIHHFYYDFYVYQYATSFSAAQAIASNMLTKGQTAIDKYLDFLKSGKTDYAIPTLMKAGVDMNTPEPFLSVIERAKDLLDKLEKLSNE